jgi:hypothetical protein
MSSVKRISYFSSITERFTEDTLLVLDIDETVLTWNDDLSSYSHKDWLNYIHQNEPLLTDNRFLSFIRDKDYIFLTARSEDLDYITEHHLSLLNIPYSTSGRNGTIYYTNEGNKGLHLRRIRREKYRHKKKFICIDDMLYNLEDELKHNQDVDVIPYLFSV